MTTTMRLKTLTGLLLCYAVATHASENVPPAVPQDEIAVYAALLQLHPPGGIATPQFFDDVPTCRRLLGHTLTSDYAPDTTFGPLPDELGRDFSDKNRTATMITGPVPVGGVVVVPPDSPAARLPREGENAPALPGNDCLLTFSRVGFDRMQEAALLDVRIAFSGGMQATYRVLMKTQNGSWALDKVRATGMRIP